jgi:hypothetical protein
VFELSLHVLWHAAENAAGRKEEDAAGRKEEDAAGSHLRSSEVEEE